MSNTVSRKGLWLALIALVYGALCWQAAALPPTGGFAIGRPTGAKDVDPAPFYTERYASNALTPSVHSAAALAVRGGLRAFWYGGAEEGAEDVAIYTATYDLASDKWSAEEMVASRSSTAQGVNRYIRKLGNPAVLRDDAGRLWLFYVSVSVGGWSGSAINAMVSADEGRTWGEPRRLVSSPFFNISTLVKGRPFLYQDGSIGVPAYHEFAGKFGEILRIDAQGNVIGKTRLSHGRYSLQPVVVPRSAAEAVAFMRYSGEGPGRVLMQRTRDGGETWTQPVKLALPNPNAAIDAIGMADGGLALVFNNRQGNRDNLSLAVSDDAGDTWRVLHRFEDEPGAPPPEFSYPWLAREQDGSRFHLLYTWKRSHIKHVKFDVDWLKGRKQ
jgi:predicted neuraminidase